MRISKKVRLLFGAALPMSFSHSAFRSLTDMAFKAAKRAKTVLSTVGSRPGFTGVILLWCFINSSDADTFCTTTTALSGREVHETVSAVGR